MGVLSYSETVNSNRMSRPIDYDNDKVNDVSLFLVMSSEVERSIRRGIQVLMVIGNAFSVTGIMSSDDILFEHATDAFSGSPSADAGKLQSMQELAVSCCLPVRARVCMTSSLFILPPPVPNPQDSHSSPRRRRHAHA